MTTALAIPMPSAAASLDSYIQAVGAFPLLSADEEYSLATRLRQYSDLDAARTLVLSHLRLVVNVARGYAGYGLPQADLIQEGNIGLMKAVRRFDPERGVRLVSFALHWIKAEIHEFILRNWRMVKIATTKAQRKLFFNLRSLKQGLGYLTQDEVKGMAKHLGVREQDVMEMETRLAGQDLALEGYGDDDDDTYGPIDYLADPHAEPSAQLESQQLERMRGDGLERALLSLDERSRNIIEARWLSETKSATLTELAEEYGVSAERIRQIEQKALVKLRHLIGAEV